MTPPVKWLDEISTAPPAAGGKLARLAELRQTGIHVPQGFAVTIDAYRRHCAESGINELIDAVVNSIPSSAEPKLIQAASAELRTTFERIPMSDELAEAIIRAYGQMSSTPPDAPLPVAVRSSATGEDGDAASFAGNFETYLGISGPDHVLRAVRKCWASLFTPRAITYRAELGISHRDMPMAVGVMELVEASASGVAFSLNPATGKRDRVVIEGSWGFGDAVVQGLVTPDHIEVGKGDGRLLRYEIGHKTVVSSTDVPGMGVAHKPMPADLQDRPTLNEEQINAIADVVTRIEDHYRHPVDVEWVLSHADEPTWVVQVRPVTATDLDAGPSLAVGGPSACVTKQGQGSR